MLSCFDEIISGTTTSIGGRANQHWEHRIMLRQNRADLCLCLMFVLSTIALSAQGRPPMETPAIVESESDGDNDIAAVAPEEIAPPAAPSPVENARAVQTGIASWYGLHWQGRRTASGTRFDTRLLTAAHRSLPLNTIVRVTNLLNGRTVEVLVNDRGPYVGHRVIDLSEAAAQRLDMVKKGVVPVRIETVPPPQQVAMLMKPL
jgi:rare lipoprotein A